KADKSRLVYFVEIETVAHPASQWAKFFGQWIPAGLRIEEESSRESHRRRQQTEQRRDGRLRKGEDQLVPERQPILGGGIELALINGLEANHAADDAKAGQDAQGP